MLVADLNSRALAVVQAGRKDLLPPAGARERVEALLAARLAAPVPSPASSLRPRSVKRWWPAAIAVGLAGGAAVLMLRAKPSDAPQPVTAPPAPPALSSPAAVLAPVLPASAPAVVEQAPAVDAPVEARSAPRARDRLAEEVALLSRATVALRAGRAAEALGLLDEHRRSFAKGLLSVERTALRAQALCSLARVSEGRAELAQLAPQSPAAGRAAQVCDNATSAAAK